jgi:hypothetical protein
VSLRVKDDEIGPYTLQSKLYGKIKVVAARWKCVILNDRNASHKEFPANI